LEREGRAKDQNLPLPLSLSVIFVGCVIFSCFFHFCGNEKRYKVVDVNSGTFGTLP